MNRLCQGGALHYDSNEYRKEIPDMTMVSKWNSHRWWSRHYYLERFTVATITWLIVTEYLCYSRFLVRFVLLVMFCRSFVFYHFSYGHCVVCPSSIYGFSLSLWYLQTLILNNEQLFSWHGRLEETVSVSCKITRSSSN